MACVKNRTEPMRALREDALNPILGAVRVLVVEDEKKMASFVRKALSAEGFAVDVLHHGDEVLPAVSSTNFDVVVMDIMLPGRDGMTVLREMRGQGISTPVLLLTARGQVDDRVNGLNAGADDYLPKPFILAELIARVRALTRRGGETRAVVLQLDDLTVDTVTRVVKRGERVIELAPREYRLLEFLMRSPGRVCSRMAIVEKVWDYDFDPGTNLVDVYIMRLREKIDGESDRRLVHTVRGVGYVMKENR
jgi:DNA-binding response OmpR family regulator